MNAWFSNFLESLFQRAGACKPMWLTAKQTSVCIQYMECETIRYDSDGYGTMYNHDNYFCSWDGRRVFMCYSKKNGCGRIEFGMNEAEQQETRIQNEAERKQFERKRIERLKRNPERLAKRIADLKSKIALHKQYWEDDKKWDGYTEADEAWYSSELEKYESELAAYTE